MASSFTQISTTKALDMEGTEPDQSRAVIFSQDGAVVSYCYEDLGEAADLWKDTRIAVSQVGKTGTTATISGPKPPKIEADVFSYTFTRNPGEDPVRQTALAIPGSDETLPCVQAMVEGNTNNVVPIVAAANHNMDEMTALIRNENAPEACVFATVDAQNRLTGLTHGVPGEDATAAVRRMTCGNARGVWKLETLAKKVPS